MIDKQAIRQEMRAQRKALSPAAKVLAARVICDKILTSLDITAALERGRKVVAAYLASPDEIDLMAAIEGFSERGVIVVVPRWNGKTYELARLKSLKTEDLRFGPMGIPEPKEAEIVSPKDVAVWLVPGLAFTLRGARLGYGGGWYDRLMAEASELSLRLGIAHAFQIVDDLPREAHDVSLTEVLYEN